MQIALLLFADVVMGPGLALRAIREWVVECSREC